LDLDSAWQTHEHETEVLGLKIKPTGSDLKTDRQKLQAQTNIPVHKAKKA